MPAEESISNDRWARKHVPVLLAESLYWLAPRHGVFVDCTLGAAGHAVRLLEADAGVRLVGIDRDPVALGLATERLEPFQDRVELVQGRFDQLEEILGRLKIEKVDGIFADLGVSSMQLETAERGFSFRFSGPLDMRMGADATTAGELLNGLEEADLYRILREYGEERKARRIAREIVRRREVRPLETTEDLTEAVRAAVGPTPRNRAHRNSKIHPATRTFQALRIAVNEELTGLQSMLDGVTDLLNPEGRLVLISYHSLEDRIVKHTLRGMAEVEKDQITGRPLTEQRAIEVLTKKPIRPSVEEVNANPRSRSAKLRAARRV